MCCSYVALIVLTTVLTMTRHKIVTGMQQYLRSWYTMEYPACHLNFLGVHTLAQKLLIIATKHTQVTCEMLRGIP